MIRKIKFGSSVKILILLLPFVLLSVQPASATQCLDGIPDSAWTNGQPKEVKLDNNLVLWSRSFSFKNSIGDENTAYTVFKPSGTTQDLSYDLINITDYSDGGLSFRYKMAIGSKAKFEYVYKGANCNERKIIVDRPMNIVKISTKSVDFDNDQELVKNFFVESKYSQLSFLQRQNSLAAFRKYLSRLKNSQSKPLALCDGLSKTRLPISFSFNDLINLGYSREDFDPPNGYNNVCWLDFNTWLRTDLGRFGGVDYDVLAVSNSAIAGLQIYSEDSCFVNIRRSPISNPRDPSGYSDFTSYSDFQSAQFLKGDASCNLKVLLIANDRTYVPLGNLRVDNLNVRYEQELAKKLATQEAEIRAATDKAAADLKAKQEAAAKAAAELKAKQEAETKKTLATKKSTITCIKGKLIKKVSAVKPRCPVGFKQR